MAVTLRREASDRPDRRRGDLPRGTDHSYRDGTNSHLERLGVDWARYNTFRIYSLAWVSGTLGGTLFTVKWLYHSVGKGFWNADRLAWRIFTPHLSGGFSFGLLALATSGIFEILNRELLRSSPAIVGTGFVLGYFSDFTVARLYKVAEHLLGGTRDDRGRDGS